MNMNKKNSFTNLNKGVQYMLIASFTFAIMGAFAKLASQSMSSLEVVFFRNIAGVVIVGAAILKHPMQHVGGKLLLLDEIQRVKDFSTHIKAIYDFTDLQVIFSGSSAINIKHKIGDLSRRALVYDLPVLSFREYLALKNIAYLPPYTLEEIIASHEDIAVEIL